MTPEQEARAKIACQTLIAIIFDMVKATRNPFGMPGGELYAMLMPIPGMTLHMFEAIMSALVMTGQLVKKHQCYLPGPNFPGKKAGNPT